MNDPNCTTLSVFGLIVFAAVMYHWRRGYAPSKSAHGTAAWQDDRGLSKAGYFAGNGLVFGRSMESGRLMWVPSPCHTLLVGGTGHGKGIGVIIPVLLTYSRGSRVVWDMKHELIEIVRKRCPRQRIIDLAPFNGGKDKFNIFDSISPDSPLLIDMARSVSEMLVYRTGTEPDAHWTESAVMVICAVSVFVLQSMRPEERNLNSVREICADPALLDVCARNLLGAGGIPARMGYHILGLQEKEKAGVMSTVARNLSFLDSEMVADAVSSSTFDPLILRNPGVTSFIRIGAEHAEAQRNLLRCWIGMLVKLLGTAGNNTSETLFVIDEASALNALPALEESLVRGRSAGVRLLLAYQSESQVRAAFPAKPTLIQDNCDTTIYLCPPSGTDSAEAIAKRVGDSTIEIESGNENESRSWSYDCQHGESGQGSRSWGINRSVMGRPLLRLEEICVLPTDTLIAFCRGLRPIFARRISWFKDPVFNGSARRVPAWLWLLVLVGVGLLTWSVFGF